MEVILIEDVKNLGKKVMLLKLVTVMQKFYFTKEAWYRSNKAKSS